MIARRFCLAFWVAVAPLSALAEDARPPDQNAIDACRMTAERVSRLECFDRIFATPVALTAPKGPQTQSAPAANAVRSLALAQEETRRADQNDWLLAIRALVKSGDIAKALAELDSARAQAKGMRARTLWELATLELLSELGLGAHAAAQSERLQASLAAMSVSEWEPDLVRRLGKIGKAKP